MSIEHTDKSTGPVSEEAIQGAAVQSSEANGNGLHHSNGLESLRPGWMDNKVPGTDTVTVGDAMMYAGGALAIGAVAYGVYRMVKHFSDDHADAALIGGEIVTL